MQRRSQRSSTTCPQCQIQVEDKVHILRCQAESARAQWKLSMQALHRWMKDQGTALEIRNAIMTNLEQWANDSPTPGHSDDTYTEEQRRIGWDRMLDGWLTRGWRDHQEKLWKTQSHANLVSGGQRHSSRNCGMYHGICGTTATRNYMQDRRYKSRLHTPSWTIESRPYTQEEHNSSQETL